MESFIISLLSGHLFSKGVDAGQEMFEHYVKGKDLAIILDEFDQAFMASHDEDISLYNCDMEALFNKRDYLIHSAKDFFSRDNSDVNKNLKQNFINAACREIGYSSDVVKTYLNQFYSLVFAKETNEVSVGFRALLNAYADSQQEINKRTDERFLWQNERISRISKTLEKLENDKSSPVDFRPYYQDVEERFIEEKNEESIVGSESDEKAYIDAYIKTKNGSIPVLPFLEEWFEKNKSDAILIHGEPGHGKTLLCRKAMVDFFRGNYLKGKAKNVIAVSLNTGENHSIIDGGNVTLSNALAWGVEQEHRFTFQECRESLLFLDGFDEFIDDAKRTDTGVDNICFFMKRVKGIANSYGIHIVVLSRSVAVFKNLNDLSNICNHFELSPISEVQQDEWMECHHEYSYYKDVFQNLRDNDNMKELIGIPLLFRLIVYNRFNTISSNVVELYNNLFIHLMIKRNIYEDSSIVERELMDLAYEIYCTDTNMAILENVAGDPHWLFTFYVKTSDKGKIGFFHRTFYQYFFAKFIYSGILDLREDVEDLIGYFAERELEFTVCQYLSLLVKEEEKSTLSTNIERMITTLCSSEGCLNPKPHVISGDAEKSRILRSTNIYRNVLYIAATFSHVIQIPFKRNMDLLVRTYNSSGIKLFSEKNREANLREANLSGANLSGAILSKTDFSGADLRRTDLKFADLSGADLRRAHLERAYLEYTQMDKTNLMLANLNGAYLNGASLREANLQRTILEEANLDGSDLSGGDLRRANLIRTALKRSNLRDVDLREADLREADLRGADLSGANLRGAQLTRANLTGASLSSADLRNSKMSGTVLRGAKLIRADLRETDLGWTYLERVNLHEAKIDIKYKRIIDPSTEGYSSIIWVSQDNDKP